MLPRLDAAQSRILDHAIKSQLPNGRNSAVKSKVAKAFDLDESVLDTPEMSTPPSLKDSAALDKLMQQLKEKVATASGREKVKLLTIVPET